MEFKLLSGLPSDDVRELLSIARRRTFQREEVVFHRGDPADTLHLISRGRFAIRIVTLLGHVALLDVLGPGDVFGEFAIVSPGRPRSATVAALEPAETFSILRDNFAGLQKRHPGVNDVLLTLFAERIRLGNERVVAAHYLDADARVRWSLLRLAQVYGIDGGQEEVVIPLTQEQISELAGAARPTVNKVLREEQKKGAVALERGRVRVVDGQALARGVRGMPESL